MREDSSDSRLLDELLRHIENNGLRADSVVDGLVRMVEALLETLEQLAGDQVIMKAAKNASDQAFRAAGNILIEKIVASRRADCVVDELRDVHDALLGEYRGFEPKPSLDTSSWDETLMFGVLARSRPGQKKIASRETGRRLGKRQKVVLAFLEQRGMVADRVEVIEHLCDVHGMSDSGAINALRGMIDNGMVIAQGAEIRARTR